MTPKCLTTLKGILSQADYDRLRKAMLEKDRKVWDTVIEEAADGIKLQRKQAIKDANVKMDIIEYLYDQFDKGVKPAQALSDLISGSGSRQKSGRVSLDKYIDGIRGSNLAELVDQIHASRPKNLGLTRRGGDEYSQNLAKNIFGDADAGGAGKGLDKVADAWKNVTQRLLERFNKAGGNIKELEEFYLPVNHYAPEIQKVGKAAWVDDALTMFKIRQLPSAAELSPTELLGKIYDNIVTEGTKIVDFSDVGRRNFKKLSNSHQEFRWLQPKNGASWIDYNKKYGRHAHPIDAMIEYVDGMSTEIGLMETLGTNPTKMLDDIVEEVRINTGNKQAGALARASLDMIRSRNPGYESKVSDMFRGFRNFQTVTKLGTAPLTAVSDLWYSAITAVYNGMSPVKVLTRHLKNLNPLIEADRLAAGRLGLLMDYALNKAAAVNRYSEISGFGKLYKAADFSTRASGLNHWTNSAKTSFGLEFLANMADMHKSGKSNKGLIKALDRYGISEDDFAALGKTITKEGGTDFVNPAKLADDKLQARVIGMIREETTFAVPEPNARSRAVASGGIPTNTVANEFVKVLTQFKSFPVAITMSHLARALDQDTMISRIGYFASLLTGATALGMVVKQAKDLARGRALPEDLEAGDWASLVAEGAMQGGTLGILGDLFFNDPELFGGTPAFMVGPTIGDFEKLRKAMWSTKDEFFEGGFMQAWEEELVPSMISGAEQVAFPTRFWYTRVAFERSLWDKVNRLTDPKYTKKIRNRQKWLRKERNKEYWWQPE